VATAYSTRRNVPYAPSSTALASPPPAAVFCAACTASVPPAFTTSEPFNVTSVYAAVLESKYFVPLVVVVDCVLTAVLLSVGVVPKTSAPVPVSFVTAVMRFALVGVARNAATPVPRPEMPVSTGKPVQLVSVPDAGVPSVGLVKTGLASTTPLGKVGAWLNV